MKAYCERCAAISAVENDGRSLPFISFQYRPRLVLLPTPLTASLLAYITAQQRLAPYHLTSPFVHWRSTDCVALSGDCRITRMMDSRCAWMTLLLDTTRRGTGWLTGPPGAFYRFARINAADGPRASPLPYLVPRSQTYAHENTHTFAHPATFRSYLGAIHKRRHDAKDSTVWHGAYRVSFTVLRRCPPLLLRVSATTVLPFPVCFRALPLVARVLLPAILPPPQSRIGLNSTPPLPRLPAPALRRTNTPPDPGLSLLRCAKIAAEEGALRVPPRSIRAAVFIPVGGHFSTRSAALPPFVTHTFYSEKKKRGYHTTAVVRAWR